MKNPDKHLLWPIKHHWLRWSRRGFLASWNLLGELDCVIFFFSLFFMLLDSGNGRKCFGFFLFYLLGWHWLIKLYRFQGYISITRYLYVVLCVHHPKSSLLSSPPIPSLPSSPFPHPPFSLVITTLFSVSMKVFLSSLHLSHPAPEHLPPPPTADYALSVYKSVSILFVTLRCALASTYEWDHTVLVFLWLPDFTEHNALQAHPCCSNRSGFLLFCGHGVFLCVNVPQLFLKTF